MTVKKRIAYPPVTPLMRGVVTLGTFWALTGLYLDGLAHISSWVESFFTWFHLVLYSGVLVPAGALALMGLGKLRAGYPLRRMLPKPYLIALLGAGLFFLSGFADLAWHEIFGFEEDLEALLSPSHLLLAVGGFLIFNAPLREYLSRPVKGRARDVRGLLPAWVAWFGHLSILSFFTQYTNAFAHPNLFAGTRPAGDHFVLDTALISHVFWPAVMLVSFVLIGLRWWKWPRGFFTILLSVHAASLWLMYWNEPAREYGWVMLNAPLAGILIDLLYGRMQPSYEGAEGRRALRRFAFWMPLIIFLSYFGVLISVYGGWWKIHMWLGAPIAAGVIGWMLGMLAAPPEMLGEGSDG